MRKLLIGLLVVIVAVVGFRVWRNAAISEEERVRRVIQAGERAIEGKDLAGVAKHISADYSDAFEMDKRTAIMLAQRLFQEYDKFFIHLQALEVEIAEGGETAHARFMATVLASYRGAVEQKRLVEKGRDRFLLTFRKEDGNWRLLSAQQVEYRFK